MSGLAVLIRAAVSHFFDVDADDAAPGNSTVL